MLRIKHIMTWLLVAAMLMGPAIAGAAQHDYEITTADANTGVTFRADVNAALQALASLSSGATAPSTTYAFQLWADTGNDQLKIRNAANDAWITVGRLSSIYLGLASLSAQNDFTATQKIKGDALLLRIKDTGASGEEWAIRSDGGIFEIVKNTGTEGSPTWTVQSSLDVNAVRLGDGTASDIRIVANNNAATKPEIRYQNSTSKWQYSNDGASFSDLGIEASAVFVPVRQTVLSSVIDASGYANFISAGAGLAVNIDGTPTPIRIAFAAGFGTSGAIDYVGSIDSDTSISSLATSTTNFLFAERNSGTGAVTLGKVSVAPVYSYAAPSHAANQYWFSIPAMKMYLSNGSDTWTEKQVVFLGEAVTDGASVTSVINYALCGEYRSRVACPAASTFAIFNHNIGMIPDVDTIKLINTSAEYGYDFETTALNPITIDSSSNRGGFQLSKTKNVATFDYAAYINVVSLSNHTITNSITYTKWDLEVFLKRGW